MHLMAGGILLAVLAELDPNSAGRATGQGLVLIGFLAGALKCWSISRRPTTNTKCALGLMFVLLGLLVSSALAILSQMMAFTPARTLVAGLLGTCFLGCLITGLVLAIIGLTELSRQPGVFVQGRAQAIWTLVLTGVFGVIFIFGAVAGIQRAGQIAGSGRGAAAGQFVNFDELNFRFRAPDRPWVALNAAKLNKDAKLSFMRRAPEVYFTIIAERAGSAQDFTCERLAEIGKAHLESAAESSRVVKETPYHLNGLDGLLVDTEVSLHGEALFYQHWYIATNGFAYQLIGYGLLRERSRIVAELGRLFSRFELGDPTRVAFVGGPGFRTNFASSQYHYSVAVTNSVWHAYHSLQKDLPEAEFGASRGDSCLVVVPVWLAGESPGLESLTAGLLAVMGIKYPAEELQNRSEYAPNQFEGVRYDYERDVEKTRYHYRLGILRGTDTAYLVAAWTQRRAADAESILADAFARVQFDSGVMPLLSAARPYTPQERKTQAFVLNHAGLFHYNDGDYEQALPLFRAAARINGFERIYVINALQTWRHLERPRETLEFLRSQPAAILQNPDVRAWQAYFQAEASLTDEALTNYANLFTDGYHEDTHFSQYVNLLNAQRRFPEALAAIETYLKKEDSIPVRLLEAQTYRLRGDLPKAISLLKQQREKAPFNFQVAGALAETSLAAGLYNDALEITREMAKRNRDSAYALYLRGRSEFGLKWYREAKTSFEAAAKHAPADKTISSYLELVGGVLGEGNNSAVKEPIEPVAIPLAWTNAPGKAVPEGYARGYGAYYLRRIVAVSWQPGKEHKTTEYLQVQLLDSSGVSAFSTLQRPFDPLSEQLFVNEVRVLDRAGNTISTGKLADDYVLDEHPQDIATHRKVLNIPVPGLQPGCQLLATITRRELGKLEEFAFFENPFSGGFPIRESLVLLTGDATGLKYRSAPPGEPEKLREGLCWRCAEPLVVRYEPLEPPLATFAPMLWIADGSARWTALVTNYLASIADRLEPDTAVAEQSRKVVAGADKMAGKIAALGDYVQTNYTYKAIEFGRRARIPNKAAEVMGNKYGDCKDHAVLLQQMLTAAGVPARLALVSHNSPVQQDLPSLDQFDHMIVFVPIDRGLFIDVTDKGSDPVCGSPVGLAGRDALILDRDNPRFATIPGPTEDVCGIELERRLRVVDQESVVGEETVTARGIHAAYLRNFLRQIPPPSRRMVFQQQTGLADVELTDFKAEPLATPREPLVIQYAYTLKKQFHRSKGHLSGVVRAALERTYLAPGPVDNRLTPFEIRIPLRLKSTVSVEIPQGFAAELPADLTPQLDSRFAACTNSWWLEGGSLKARFECRQPEGEFKSSDYTAFRETMAHALSLLEKELVFNAIQGAGN
ncbi:MAG TPA: transglutaminase domain-containing protein [Candidatus Acidoferrum sp.]|jgi:tetratricopeptide (TPR) repeat protein|nr:transglutaminase domain-containing protein [Candidatus Acidoferrum sp.]